MKRIIVLLFLLAASFGAQAVDRQYCRCGPLAQASCAATSPDTPSEFTINASADGDKYLFCRGGDWSDRTGGFGVVTPTACQPLCANKITFDSYTAAWGGTNKPKVGCVNNCIAFVFGESESSTVNGGYVIQNLDFGGDSEGLTAIYIQSQLSDMLITGNDFGYWDGVFIELKEGSPAETTKKLRNIRITYNTFDTSTSGASVACIHGAASDLLIEWNTFDRCGGCPATCHTMYVNPRADDKVTIRYNTMSRAGAYVDSGGGITPSNDSCRSGNISYRGMSDQLLVEYNIVNNSAAAPETTCGGINIKPAYCFECIGNMGQAAIWDAEYLRRVVLRGNAVINAGNLSLFELGAARYFLVENNLCLRTFTHSNTCFDTPGGSVESGRTYDDETDLGGTFRNNTCRLEAAGDGATCFVWGTNVSAGTLLKMSNNIAQLTSAQSGTQSCYKHQQLSDYTVWNNNICAGSWDRWSTTGSAGGGYANHSAAHAAGFDTWSTAGGLADDDPLLTSPTSGNGWSVAITSDSSPAHNTGSNTYKAKFDRLGCVRDSTPSIGAFERGGTNCQTTTGAPQFVR